MANFDNLWRLACKVKNDITEAHKIVAKAQRAEAGRSGTVRYGAERLLSERCEGRKKQSRGCTQ